MYSRSISNRKMGRTPGTVWTIQVGISAPSIQYGELNKDLRFDAILNTVENWGCSSGFRDELPPETKRCPGLMEIQGDENFRFLAENSVDMVCRVGLDLVMHYASPSCEQLLGWKPAEMVGRGPDAFVLPEDLPVVAAAHERLARDGIDPSPTVVRMRRKDATLATMEVNARMVRDHETGEALGIVLIMRDITRHAGHDLHRGVPVQAEPTESEMAGYVLESEWERTRHESEERFSMAFGLAPVPMAVAVLDGLRIVDVNDTFTSTTGYARAEVAGRKAVELNLLGNRTCRHIETALKKGRSLRNEEIRMRSREGTPIDCLISAETTTLGGQRCILAAFQDITERKRSEGELIAALDSVMSDTSWFSQAFVEKLAQIRQRHRSNEPPGELADLTSREREVLSLMCEGLNDDEISVALLLSRNTVRNHVSRIYSKIGVHRRGTAIVWARERGVSIYGAPPVRERRRKRLR